MAYLGALAALFISAFWTVNSFTGDVIRQPTLDNFRTIAHRAASTAPSRCAASGSRPRSPSIDAVIALPMAFFMAKVAQPRYRKWLVIAILTPLWASYLVKAYAWRVMLANGGLVDWLFGGGATARATACRRPSWCCRTCGCRT